MDHHSTDDIDTEAARLLGPLTDLEPTGPPRYGVTALVASGRRRRRARRTAAATGIAAVTALALLGGGLAAHGRSRHPAVVPGSSAAARVTGPRVALDRAPAAFDPATLLITVDRQPAGTNQRMVHTNRYWEVVSYRQVDTAGAADTTLSVSLFAAGAGWDLLDWSSQPDGRPANTGTPQGDPGPTIQGHRSVVVGGVSGVTLLWQWAPGAWAAVGADSDSGGDPLAEAVRTVDALTIAAMPLPLPFTAARPPAGYPLREADAWSGPNGDYGATLTFSDRLSMLNDDRSARMLEYDVTRNARRTGDGKKIVDPNTTIDGHPAYVHGDGLGASTWLFDVTGTLIKVDSSYPATTLDTTPLARTIAPVPTATDPANWSTAPLR